MIDELDDDADGLFDERTVGRGFEDGGLAGAGEALAGGEAEQGEPEAFVEGFAPAVAQARARVRRWRCTPLGPRRNAWKERAGLLRR